LNLKGETSVLKELREKTIQKFSIEENSLSDQIVNILLRFTTDKKFLELSANGRFLNKIALKTSLKENITKEGLEFKEGLRKLSKKINTFIEKKNPIIFYGPFFSFRGLPWQDILGLENYKKITWTEVLSLKTMNALLKKIKSIYEPGAKIKIYSDGRVFEQCFDEQNLAGLYIDKINKVIKQKELENIEIILPDFEISKEERENIDKDFIEKKASTKELILFNYYGKYFPQKTKEEVKLIAYRAEQYAFLFSEYIKELDNQNNIRISIHEGKKDYSEKLPIEFLWGSDATAPHAFPLINKNKELRFLTAQDIQNTTLIGKFSGKEIREVEIKEQEGFLYALEKK
jgi:pyoverdine/dityrosine biosynthesis protein Dit1